MSREKLKEKIDKIHTYQLYNAYECEDLYPIDSDILAYAYDYIPIKILKRIIERHKEENEK